MNTSIPSARDLILVGGGHSNVQVLKYFAMHKHPGVRITLVSDSVRSPYSGMIPGVLAGIYRSEDAYINLERLCQFSGARFLCAKVMGVDTDGNHLLFDSRPPTHFDLLCLNIGSVPEVKFDGALSIKPISEFETQLDYFDQNIVPGSNLAIVGSGAAGIELSFALRARYKNQVAINLIGKDLAAGIKDSARQIFLKEFSRKKIRFIQDRVIDFNGKTLSLDSGTEITANYVIQATNVVAQSWIRSSGLETDSKGFVRVNNNLQSVSHPKIFAAGDTVCLEGQERPKSGVFAVRAAKFLVHNLVSFLAGKKMKTYRAQKHQLALINVCDGTAIAIKGKYVSHSKIWWHYKNYVDKRFVGQFNDVVFMQEPNIKIPKEYADEISGNLMRCNGCGAKVAADPLKRVLERLDVLETKSVELGVGDDSARIVTASGKMLLTIDGFRSLVSDPYLFGRITAHHSLNDIFAMGATPTVALCLATIPYMAEKLMEEELYQLLSGVNDVLKEHNVALVGGHSAEGIETSLGLMVTGLESGRSKQKNHARAGEVLILTKPLGTGVILASASIGKASARSVSKCFDQMNQSNYEAMKLLLSENVSALTDITGYGLIGHLVEVLKASHCGATLDLTAIPTLVDAESLMSIGHVSSLQQSNEAALRDFDLGKGLTFSMPKVRLLVDPQTAGGLLASVPQENESSCLSKLSELGYQSASIGRIEEKVWAIR